MLARMYTIFWTNNVLIDLEEEDDGANGANAVLIAATFLNGLNISMNTIPMLKIWTPPPDMYSMNACIGRDLAGEMARSHALFCFRASCENTSFEVLTDFEGLFVCWVVRTAVHVVRCEAVCAHG